MNDLSDATDSASDFFARVSDITTRAGFDYCSLGVRRQMVTTPRAESWHTTYPSAWQAYYHAHQFLLSDPVIIAALHSSLPVVWSEDNHVHGNDHFWETASAHGVQHGWTMALRGPRDETMLISLARSSQAMSQRELVAKQPHLLWLAHSVLAMLTSAEDSAEADFDLLSDREKEILRWSLAGKTAEETAMIVGITQRTVNFHIAVIMQRLQVSNKTQAVAKAIALNLLE
ncbi:MAG: autoinducer binding domain-containing protein [Xanthomonadales bacterium]|nr:autoinducer binding domain-containing protein [Xanthomonadales bacterium]